MLMYMDALPACMPVHNVCELPLEARKGTRSLGTEIIDGYKPAHGLWKQNPDPLEEK